MKDRYKAIKDTILHGIIAELNQKSEVVKTAMDNELYTEAYAIANQAKGMVEALYFIIDVEENKDIMQLLEEANQVINWLQRFNHDRHKQTWIYTTDE